MKLTDDQSLIDIVDRLVKEGSIDFKEAIKLLEVKESVVYMPMLQPITQPYSPWSVPGPVIPTPFPWPDPLYPVPVTVTMPPATCVTFTAVTHCEN